MYNGSRNVEVVNRVTRYIPSLSHLYLSTYFYTYVKLTYFSVVDRFFNKIKEFKTGLRKSLPLPSIFAHFSFSYNIPLPESKVTDITKFDEGYDTREDLEQLL